MNIGLLGFGVVGRGVYEITTAREDMQVTLLPPVPVLRPRHRQIPQCRRIRIHRPGHLGTQYVCLLLK